MSFSDWEFQKFDGAETVVIDTDDPIDGPGSLLMKGAGNNSAGYVTMNPTVIADPDRGRTQGQIQTLFQRNQPSGGGFNHGAGIYFMPSSTSPWEDGESTYWAGLSNDGSTTRWAVIKFTDGIDAWENSTGATVLDNDTTNLPDNGENLALQVEWNNGPEFGGVRIILRASTPNNTDFNDVEDIIIVTDTVNPLTNADIAEGFLVGDVQGLSGVNQVAPRWDETSIFSLVPA